MKTFAFTCLAVVCVLGAPRTSAAQAARFRFLSAVYADGQGIGFSAPEGVACGAGGQILIADTANNRLVRFTYADKALTGGTEIKIPQLVSPARVQLNSKGEIYALDSAQRRLIHLGPDASFKEAVSFSGVPAPATVVPKSFAIDSSDNLLVLDAFGSRVLMLDPQGQFQKALPLPDDAGFASDVTVDVTGNVLVIDAVGRRLFAAAKDAGAFTPLGGSLSQYVTTMPAYLTTSKGTIYVVEGEGSRIVALGKDGSFLSRQLTMGWNEGSLNYPSQICINDKDEAFIADRDNSRVQVFQLIR